MNLDALLQPIPEKQPEPCAIGRIVRDLTDPHRTALIDLVKNQQVTAQGLTDILAQAGFSTSANTIRTHRRYECKCTEELR